MRHHAPIAIALLLAAVAPASALDSRRTRSVLEVEHPFASPAAHVPSTLVLRGERALGGDLEASARAVLAGRAAELGLPAASELELHAVRRGKAVDVVRFRQTVAGVPVLRGAVAVSFNRKGEAIFVANDLKPVLDDLDALAGVASSPVVAAEAARSAAIAHLGLTGRLNHDRSELAVFPAADRARLVWAVRLEPASAPHGDWEALIDAENGELLRVEDLAHYGDVGQGQAFLPDPLSSALVAYGTPGYVDGDDADTAQLIAEIFDVVLHDLTFTSPNWTLVGPYADCRGQLENPFTDCIVDVDGDFRFSPATRAHQGFEEIQNYYHIDTYMRYMNLTLGVPVAPYQYVGGVRYDSHGLSGADNSHYSSGSGAVAFGDGCVDDSEDPDVVIHELGHGIHDWVTVGGLSQNQGLSEGTGDYFAVSYSRSFFPGQWVPADPHYNWVFGWDGHNTCWGGRRTNWNDDHLYPNQLTGSIHTDGQFWSSCNLDIAEAIGYPEADTAVLEGLSMTGGGTNQADAAQAVMLAAAELGYDSATLTTMVGLYNDSSGGFGCNYGVVSPIFADDFESGDDSGWDLVVVGP